MTDFTRRVIAVTPRCWILLGLTAMTFSIYWQTAGHSFITLDDEALIYGNPHVRSGLTLENVAWAFTSTSGDSFWHPLTWLSHMADVELFGLDPGGHHLMSMGIHTLNAIVLFLVLLRMTRAMWRSGFVAALFAVHPLHVESVAWAAERKDVLSALFYLLAIWAYARYAERPGWCRYGLVVLLFAFSLMSKPMGVTFPFALLLLDYWPLGRIRGMAPEGGWPNGTFPPAPLGRILQEKVPLLLMAAGSIAITLRFDGGPSWVGSLKDYPLWVRAANAVVSYATYLWKTAWPMNLVIYYPHPGSQIPMWKVAAGGLILAVATFFFVRSGIRRPYLPVGWFFYLGTLVPVIGLMQVGEQAMADRYTYVPLIGIFIVIVWSIREAMGSLRHRRYVFGALGVAVLLAFSAASWIQTRYWKNSTTLFVHALQVSENNYFAWFCLGNADNKLGNHTRAQEAFREALRIKPFFAEAWKGLGIAYRNLGRYPQAIEAYREAVRISPDDFETWNNIGAVYSDLGQYPQAIEAYRKALHLQKNQSTVWCNLGIAYRGLGEYPKAIESYREALRLDPTYALARQELEMTLLKTEKMK